jgi:hypothetical protein
MGSNASVPSELKLTLLVISDLDLSPILTQSFGILNRKNIAHGLPSGDSIPLVLAYKEGETKVQITVSARSWESAAVSLQQREGIVVRVFVVTSIRDKNSLDMQPSQDGVRDMCILAAPCSTRVPHFMPATSPMKLISSAEMWQQAVDSLVYHLLHE